jgi:hypothetical protein
MAEEHVQMRRGITQGRTEQYPLLPFPPPRRALYIAQVVVSDRLELRVVARGEDAERAGAQVRPQIWVEEEKGREEQAADKQYALDQRSPPPQGAGL